MKEKKWKHITEQEFGYIKYLLSTGMSEINVAKKMERSTSVVNYIKRSKDLVDYKAFTTRLWKKAKKETPVEASVSKENTQTNDSLELQQLSIIAKQLINMTEVLIEIRELLKKDDKKHDSKPKTFMGW